MDQHDIGGGVDLEHRVNGEQAAPERPKRGRPRNVDREPESPIGRTYSKFEAKTIIKDLTERIAAIREGSSEDEYAAMYVDMRVELLQAIVDRLQREIDSK